jgi:ABC-type uncharacterized transport system involved in gliding motility auxiliary subunit
MRRSPLLLTVLGLVLAGVLFISVSSITARLFPRASIDLTDQGLYTLSDGTRAILRRMDEPITLKFYYSTHLGDVVPSYGVYADHVRALLQKYASLAGGKIHLEILNPTPFSEMEDQATAAGLQAVPLEQGGETVYFGLAGSNSTDDTETIPFFQREREKFLEYDLSRMVQALAFPKKKVVGLISSLQLEADPVAQMRGQQSQPQAVLDQLRQNYEVRDLPPTTDTIPDDVDVLMIVQPLRLGDKAEYAIDQYVLRGGHALVFADPYSEFSAAHRSPMSPPAGAAAAEFDRMLNSWGVSLVPGKFVGDRTDATEVNGGDADHPVQTEYLAWLSLHGDDINANDPITGRLTQINVGSAGSLVPTKGAKTSFEPLLQSSTDSNLIDVSRISGTPIPDFLGLLADFKPTGQRYTIAARVTGPATTAFPSGPPKAVIADKSDKLSGVPEIKTAQQPIDIVVVADTDMLGDQFWIQFQDFMGRKVGTPIANNGDFVQNAVDSLAGTADLINLRSRGTSARPFTLVDSMRRAADDRYRTHEKELETKLQEAQQKLASIKPADDTGSDVALTPEQQKTVDQVRSEIISTRTELRQVQLALRENIDTLKNQLVFFNVVLVPLLVALVAVFIGVLRVRRRQRRAAAQ